ISLATSPDGPPPTPSATAIRRGPAWTASSLFSRALPRSLTATVRRITLMTRSLPDQRQRVLTNQSPPVRCPVQPDRRPATAVPGAPDTAPAPPGAPHPTRQGAPEPHRALHPNRTGRP